MRGEKHMAKKSDRDKKLKLATGKIKQNLISSKKNKKPKKIRLMTWYEYILVVLMLSNIYLATQPMNILGITGWGIALVYLVTLKQVQYDIAIFVAEKLALEE